MQQYRSDFSFISRIGDIAANTVSKLPSLRMADDAIASDRVTANDMQSGVTAWTQSVLSDPNSAEKLKEVWGDDYVEKINGMANIALNTDRRGRTRESSADYAQRMSRFMQNFTDLDLDMPALMQMSATGVLNPEQAQAVRSQIERKRHAEAYEKAGELYRQGKIREGDAIYRQYGLKEDAATQRERNEGAVFQVRELSQRVYDNNVDPHAFGAELATVPNDYANTEQGRRLMRSKWESHVGYKLNELLTRSDGDSASIQRLIALRKPEEAAELLTRSLGDMPHEVYPYVKYLIDMEVARRSADEAAVPRVVHRHGRTTAEEEGREYTVEDFDKDMEAEIKRQDGELKRLRESLKEEGLTDAQKARITAEIRIRSQKLSEITRGVLNKEALIERYGDFNRTFSEGIVPQAYGAHLQDVTMGHVRRGNPKKQIQSLENLLVSKYAGGDSSRVIGFTDDSGAPVFALQDSDRRIIAFSMLDPDDTGSVKNIESVDGKAFEQLMGLYTNRSQRAEEVGRQRDIADAQQRQREEYQRGETATQAVTGMGNKSILETATTNPMRRVLTLFTGPNPATVLHIRDTAMRHMWGKRNAATMDSFINGVEEEVLRLVDESTGRISPEDANELISYYSRSNVESILGRGAPKSVVDDAAEMVRHTVRRINNRSDEDIARDRRSSQLISDLSEGIGDEEFNRMVELSQNMPTLSTGAQRSESERGGNIYRDLSEGEKILATMLFENREYSRLESEFGREKALHLLHYMRARKRYSDKGSEMSAERAPTPVAPTPPVRTTGAGGDAGGIVDFGRARQEVRP